MCAKRGHAQHTHACTHARTHGNARATIPENSSIERLATRRRIKGARQEARRPLECYVELAIADNTWIYTEVEVEVRFHVVEQRRVHQALALVTALEQCEFTKVLMRVQLAQLEHRTVMGSPAKAAAAVTIWKLPYRRS